MAQALRLAERGLYTTVVEGADHILPPFDDEMAAIAHAHMREKQVELYLGDKVDHFEDRADHTITWRALGRFSLGGSVNGNSARFDDPANRVRMGGYATTDLRAGLRVGDAWRLQLAVTNVFDREYETARWYNQAGRTWLLSLRWHPAE